MIPTLIYAIFLPFLGHQLNISFTFCLADNSKKEDWNALVRKNTMQRDLIGSTQASSDRRERRSLRRHLLEEANKGVQMDTDQIVRK